MAKTKLHNFTVQEKLNKMDVDLIDVSVTLFDGINDVGDVMFIVKEIPNAVSVPGGTSILTSCSAIFGGGDDVGAFDIVITSDDTVLSAELGAASTCNTDAIAVMDGTCGWFGMSNAFDAGAVAIVDKRNIGMVCKAEAGSTSLYAWGIAQSVDNYAAASLVMRFGFIKD